MATDCQLYDLCGGGRKIVTRQEEEDIMVDSFFHMQHQLPYGASHAAGSRVSQGDDASSRHSQRGSVAPSRQNYYPDNQELLEFDYPAVPVQKVTVSTKDAADMDPRPMSRKASSRFKPSPQRARSAPSSHKNFDVPSNIEYRNRSHTMYNNNQVPKRFQRRYRGEEENSTVFGDLTLTQNTILEDSSPKLRSPPRSRNGIEYNEEDDSAMLGGLQFVSETGTVKPLFPRAESSQQSHQSDSVYSVDTNPVEDLPLDEYNVQLARDDYSKTSGPSLLGSLRHRLPSQTRRRNFEELEQRRRRCLRGFGILSLLLAIGIGVFAYFQIIDDQQTVTQTGQSGPDPSQVSNSNNDRKPSMAPTPMPFPNRPAEEVEEMKNSEAFNILGPQVQNPALLLDPDTPQGKAFDQIFLETTASRDDSGDGPGRNLEEIVSDERELQTEYREYRITQRFALLVLYFATAGENSWLTTLGWKVFERYECEWFGVECFNRNRVATNITLSKNGLIGELPVELCLLKELEYLVLDRNLLSGSIPDCLAKMSNLKELDLHNNDFSTALPNEFFLSDSLRTMDLSDNKFTGNIDVPSMDTDVKGFRSFGGFQEIRLDHNELEGEIDDAFMFFTGLKELTLHENHLVGGIDVMCIHPLQNLTADCPEVTCTCCTNCYNN